MFKVFFLIVFPFFLSATDCDSCFSSQSLEDLLRPKKERYLFLSLSMPRKLMKDYFKEAKTYGATIVFRGLPKEGLPKLIEELEGLTEDSELIIAPELFARFAVDHVPCLVQAKEENFDKLAGLVPLSYAFERFEEEGDL